MIDYNRKLIKRAIGLRQKMTEAERHLWHLFLKTYSVKVYRQRVIENYIADFYCSKAKLIIELDGSGHYEKDQMEYDAIRTKVFEGKGYHVIRFSNLDVEKNFDGVCSVIDMKIRELITPQSAGADSPPNWGPRSSQKAGLSCLPVRGGAERSEAEG